MIEINYQTYYDNTQEDLIDAVKRWGKEDSFERFLDNIIFECLADRQMIENLRCTIPIDIANRIDEYFKNIK